MTWWDRHPAGSEYAGAAPGTEAFFAEVEHARDATLPHLASFADFTAWGGRRVLELGCGMGCDGVRFVRAGAEYTGIDLSRASLGLMRRRLDQLGLEATLIHADAGEAGAHVRAASFDLVFAHDVLPYVADAAALIRQARRALRFDGELRITAQARASWRHAMAQAGHAPADALPGAPAGQATTAAELRAALRAQDLAAIRIEQDHIFLRAGLPRDAPLQPWFAAMTPAMRGALANLAGWHLLAVARPA